MKVTIARETVSANNYRVIRAGKVCECYVRSLPTLTQMELRYGAHELACPVYRDSLDPIDRRNDANARASFNTIRAFPRVVLTLTNKRTDETESLTVDAESVPTHVRAFATRHQLSAGDISVSTLEV